MENLDKVSTEELIKELEKRGYKWGYVYGHGDGEPAGDGEFVIADVEKTNVLISPEDQFSEPMPEDKFW